VYYIEKFPSRVLTNGKPNLVRAVLAIDHMICDNNSAGGPSQNESFRIFLAKSEVG
jgi:hypothetical protein